VSRAREKIYLDELISSAQTWLPTVRQLRPKHSWDNVVRVLNRRGHDWTVERLRRAVHRMVREKLADPELLARSPRRAPEDHLMKLVAAIAIPIPVYRCATLPASLIKWESDRRAADANGSHRPFVTCWTRRIGSASSVIEGTEHLPPDCAISHSVQFSGNDKTRTGLKMPPVLNNKQRIDYVRSVYLLCRRT
jgi:hypothetical protein